jgi:homoserine dehydrogenase
MKSIQIGLFGCGVVGSGIYRILEERASELAGQSGVKMNIKKICVRDLDRERPGIRRELLTVDGASILDDPEIDIIIEVIGGEREALGIISRALVAGKSVVTANKVVVSKYLPTLRALEDLHGGRLFYGASVCGSVPIVKVIDETLSADRISSLRGVINGSTNFILSRLASGLSWESALEEARREGFLEADPTADISGSDAAHKLSILAFHAFGEHVLPEHISTIGIEGITADDMAAAAESGCRIKLVAEARRTEHGIDLSVGPRLLPVGDPLAGVDGEGNIVELRCQGVGTQYFIGNGAGSLPTANAVVSDLLDLVSRRRYRRQGALVAA